MKQLFAHQLQPTASMGSYLPDLREDNISLYLIPVFWVCHISMYNFFYFSDTVQIISVAPRFWAAHAVSMPKTLWSLKFAEKHSRPLSSRVMR